MSEWELKRGNIQHYDLTAKSYDEQYAEEQRAKIETALKSVKISGSCLILDCGCGTGLLFEYVAEKAAMVVGLDISRKILAEAKRRAKAFGNVCLVLADADYPPFRDHVFSHVFAVTLLQNMPNPERTLTEICRVAEKDSYIIVTGLKKKFSSEVFEGLLRKLGLNIIEISNSSESLKCYVAICKKPSHH
ncbi:methyltransferase domain-containing protein [Candidatus Bathyarchaeota archaeon]|nr:methyltransferase domain-containing protein [Candidatus Bathyarchaeota archaeon]